MADLVVETGAGLPNADSYMSLADFKVYAENYGLSYGTATDDALNAALRRGTAAVDSLYGLRFPGTRKNGYAQALNWPRASAAYCDGSPIADDVVPAQIVSATAQLAWREAVTPGSTQPDFVPTQQVVREKVDVLEVEYSDPSKGSNGGALNQPVLSVVNGILSPIVCTGLYGPYVAVV